MKEQFADRLVTIKPNFSVLNMSGKEARSLVSEVCRVGSSLQLILLECDANFPADLTCINLHPMVVYIQIARQRVGGRRRWNGEGEAVDLHDYENVSVQGVTCGHTHCRCCKSW